MTSNQKETQKWVHILVDEHQAHKYPGGPEGRTLMQTNGKRQVAIPFFVSQSRR